MKQFYYMGKDYQNRDFKEIYNRLSRWLKIYFTLSGDPYFNFKGKRYRLDNFISNNSAWGSVTDILTSEDGEKIMFSGYEADSYYRPYFIEVDSCGDAVRVYQYSGCEEV